MSSSAIHLLTVVSSLFPCDDVMTINDIKKGFTEALQASCFQAFKSSNEGMYRTRWTDQGCRADEELQSSLTTTYFTFVSSGMVSASFIGQKQIGLSGFVDLPFLPGCRSVSI